MDVTDQLCNSGIFAAEHPSVASDYNFSFEQPIVARDITQRIKIVSSETALMKVKQEPSSPDPTEEQMFLDVPSSWSNTNPNEQADLPPASQFSCVQIKQEPSSPPNNPTLYELHGNPVPVSLLSSSMVTVNHASLHKNEAILPDREPTDLTFEITPKVKKEVAWDSIRAAKQGAEYHKIPKKVKEEPVDSESSLGDFPDANHSVPDVAAGKSAIYSRGKLDGRPDGSTLENEEPERKYQKTRERKAKWKSKQSQETCDRIQAADAESHRLGIQQETPEQAGARKEADAKANRLCLQQDIDCYHSSVFNDTVEQAIVQSENVLTAHSFNENSLQHVHQSKTGRDGWLDRDCMMYFLTYKACNIHRNSLTTKAVVVSPFIWDPQTGGLDSTRSNILDWMFPPVNDFNCILIPRFFNNHWTISIWMKKLKSCLCFDPWGSTGIFRRNIALHDSLLTILHNCGVPQHYQAVLEYDDNGLTRQQDCFNCGVICAVIVEQLMDKEKLTDLAVRRGYYNKVMLKIRTCMHSLLEHFIAKPLTEIITIPLPNGTPSNFLSVLNEERKAAKREKMAAYRRTMPDQVKELYRNYDRKRKAMQRSHKTPKQSTARKEMNRIRVRRCKARTQAVSHETASMNITQEPPLPEPREDDTFFDDVQAQYRRFLITRRTQAVSHETVTMNIKQEPPSPELTEDDTFFDGVPSFWTNNEEMVEAILADRVSRSPSPELEMTATVKEENIKEEPVDWESSNSITTEVQSTSTYAESSEANHSEKDVNLVRTAAAGQSVAQPRWTLKRKQDDPNVEVVSAKQFLIDTNGCQSADIDKLNERLKQQMEYQKTKSSLVNHIKVLQNEKAKFEAKIRANTKANKLDKLLADADCGVVKAKFLLDQLWCYGKGTYDWSDDTLRVCKQWAKKFPQDYKQGSVDFLTLPSMAEMGLQTGDCADQAPAGPNEEDIPEDSEVSD